MASREKSKQQKRQTREIKRLNLKIEILSEDLDEYQEVLCECDADYSIVVSVFLSFFKKKKAIQPQPVEKPEKDIETDVDRIKSPQWAKKLFKKIAKETHPDKLEHLSISNEQKAKKKKKVVKKKPKKKKKVVKKKRVVKKKKHTRKKH